MSLRSPRTRTFWRVLFNGPDFSETWFGSRAEAFLWAQAAASQGVQGLEVNRTVIRPKASRLDLLNRLAFIERCDVVPVAEWERPVKRATRRRRAS